jgi:hypothetical protein
MRDDLAVVTRLLRVLGVEPTAEDRSAMREVLDGLRDPEEVVAQIAERHRAARKT